MTNTSITDSIYILEFTRKRIIDLLNSKTTEQLNKIPASFKNNIIWNAGHCLATQNLLTYGLSGLPFGIETEFIEIFRKGTSPELMANEAYVQHIKDQLLSSPKQLLDTYKNGAFKSFQVYETSYGATLNNIEQAIAFNNTHEALHLGIMMAQSKLV